MIGLYEKLYVMISVMKISVKFFNWKKIFFNSKKWLDCMKSYA
jgi:hypothetical protein